MRTPQEGYEMEVLLVYRYEGCFDDPLYVVDEQTMTFETNEATPFTNAWKVREMIKSYVNRSIKLEMEYVLEEEKPD